MMVVYTVMEEDPEFVPPLYKEVDEGRGMEQSDLCVSSFPRSLGSQNYISIVSLSLPVWGPMVEDLC